MDFPVSLYKPAMDISISCLSVYQRVQCRVFIAKVSNENKVAVTEEITVQEEEITENSAQFFLFWVIEVKCLPRAKGEEFLKTKRGFFSNNYQGLKDSV